MKKLNFKFRKKKKYKGYTLISLLTAIKKRKLIFDIHPEEYNANFPPLAFVSERDISIARVAIDSGFVVGLDTTFFNDALSLESPVLTPAGEQYLNDQSIFKKYPIVEKAFTIILTGIVSALTTLVVSYFVNN